MNIFAVNRHSVVSNNYYFHHAILMLLILFTGSIVFQRAQAIENDSCVQNRNCASNDSRSKPIDRKSIRQANRENALKDISAPGAQLFIWGAEHPTFYTGTRITHDKALELLNENIAEEISSILFEPKEALVKDEFETTQAFEARELEYEKQYNEYVKIREAGLASEKLKIYANGFNQVLGAPTLSRIEYDADHEEFNLSISANQSDYVISAKVKTPLANAKETKEELESLTPWVVFQIDGENVSPKSVILQNKMGNISSIRRIDFIGKQNEQGVLIGNNAYQNIQNTRRLTEQNPIPKDTNKVKSKAITSDSDENLNSNRSGATGVQTLAGGITIDSTAVEQFLSVTKCSYIIYGKHRDKVNYDAVYCILLKRTNDAFQYGVYDSDGIKLKSLDVDNFSKNEPTRVMFYLDKFASKLVITLR